MSVAPGQPLEMDRWDPVVLTMDFSYRFDPKYYCCPSICACCGCCPGLVLGCPWCCCVLPDHTLQKTMDWAAANDKLGAGKNFVDYKFTHYKDNSGFQAVEIFRNADAATEYYGSFVKPGPLLCENITLSCRLKNGPVKVYGNPDEILKSKQLVQFNQIKVGDAKKGNEPTPWAEVPTLASLKAQFGDFHFGWVEKPTAKPVES